MITALRYGSNLQEAIKRMAEAERATVRATTKAAAAPKAVQPTSVHPDGADLLDKLMKDAGAFVKKLASGAFRLVRLNRHGRAYGTALKAKVVRELLGLGLLHFDYGSGVYKAGL